MFQTTQPPEAGVDLPGVDKFTSLPLIIQNLFGCSQTAGGQLLQGAFQVHYFYVSTDYKGDVRTIQIKILILFDNKNYPYVIG